MRGLPRAEVNRRNKRRKQRGKGFVKPFNRVLRGTQQRRYCQGETAIALAGSVRRNHNIRNPSSTGGKKSSTHYCFEMPGEAKSRRGRRRQGGGNEKAGKRSNGPLRDRRSAGRKNALSIRVRRKSGQKEGAIDVRTRGSRTSLPCSSPA